MVVQWLRLCTAEVVCLIPGWGSSAWRTVWPKKKKQKIHFLLPPERTNIIHLLYNNTCFIFFYKDNIILYEFFFNSHNWYHPQSVILRLAFFQVNCCFQNLHLDLVHSFELLYKSQDLYIKYFVYVKIFIPFRRTFRLGCCFGGFCFLGFFVVCFALTNGCMEHTCTFLLEHMCEHFSWVIM